jgi:hypothetical protein
MLVEANETFLKKDKARVGRSLVQASKNVFVRVMNPSSDTQIIYPGTIVAQVGPVQAVVNPNSKVDEEGELRTDLINLLERSQEHLTPKQSSEVKRLLKEYEGLFAASDSHYGRLFNIPFTCLSSSFAKTSGSLRGGCFIGYGDPLAILCFTTLVLP